MNPARATPSFVALMPFDLLPGTLIHCSRESFLAHVAQGCTSSLLPFKLLKKLLFALPRLFIQLGAPACCELLQTLLNLHHLFACSGELVLKFGLICFEYAVFLLFRQFLLAGYCYSILLISHLAERGGSVVNKQGRRSQ